MKETWRLQHFLGVAEAGSFHAAARRLNISQPALTKSIRLLEDYFGAELFFRLPRGVRLTEAGEMLLVHAREIEMTWNSAIIEVGAQSTGKGGFMRIGGGPVYSAVFMPSVLADLRRAHPHLQVAVSTDVGTQLLPLLKTGEIRCYAGGMPDNEVVLGAEFETQFLYNQESALFVSGTHPLLGLGDVDPAATLDYPWLSLFSGLQANSRIARYFTQRKLDPPVQALESH